MAKRDQQPAPEPICCTCVEAVPRCNGHSRGREAPRSATAQAGIEHGGERYFAEKAATIVTVALLALLVAATEVAAGDVTDTWKKRTEVNPAGAAGPVPVVVYVHGCSGAYARPELKADTDAWAEVATHAGWRFTIPDSLARGTWSRPDACKPTLDTALKVRLMRIEEIAYAVARLTEDPTVDKRRIVLFGHSEGGIAVASSEPPAGVRGVIVSGWTCHGALPIGTGLLAPPTMAVLAIEFEFDSILRIQGRCSDFFQGRSAARELILPGTGHNAGGSEAARQAVAEFLKGL